MVSAGTNGAGVPGVLVLICGGGRTVMAENRAEAKEGKVAQCWEWVVTNRGRLWTDVTCGS